MTVLLLKNGKELLVLIKKITIFCHFSSAHCRAETKVLVVARKLCFFFSMMYDGLKLVGFLLRTFVQLFGFKKEKNPTRF